MLKKHVIYKRDGTVGVITGHDIFDACKKNKIEAVAEVDFWTDPTGPRYARINDRWTRVESNPAIDEMIGAVEVKKQEIVEVPEE